MKSGFGRDDMRYCGHCGAAFPQSEMILDDSSDTGWTCYECDSDLSTGYDGRELAIKCTLYFDMRSNESVDDAVERLHELLNENEIAAQFYEHEIRSIQ